MTSNSRVEVSSQALKNLREDLKSLSSNLHDLYEALSTSMTSLHEDWLDAKFDEFEQEFRSSKEQIEELSEKYNEWANQYLPPRIEIIEDIEKSGMGINRNK